MGVRKVDRQAARAAADLRDRFAEDLRRLCADAGVSQRSLARHARVSESYVAEILAGTARPAIETCAKLATAIGADLSMRLYPNTGPAIRDRHQARVLESLIAIIHPRWTVHTEVAVRQPARGWIDAVLHEQREGVIVATEIESALERLEQQVRWSKAKSDALPSSTVWPTTAAATSVSSLLIVRRTRASADAAWQARRQLELAFPAHPADSLAAINGIRPWPGAALVWVQIEGERIRFRDDRWPYHRRDGTPRG